MGEGLSSAAKAAVLVSASAVRRRRVVGNFMRRGAQTSRVQGCFQALFSISEEVLGEKLLRRCGVPAVESHPL